MNRRRLITLLGATAASPLAARAQIGERVRVIGFMGPQTESDPETRRRVEAFRDGLEQRGWKEGRNVRFDFRWPGADLVLIKAHAAELLASGPDLIVCGITPGVQELQRQTRSIPVLFANIADPVGSGLVGSLAKPDGNVTGFTAVEYAIVGKWLELLKEIAPRTERVALTHNPDVIFSKNFVRSLQEAAPAFGVHVVPAETRNAVDIEHALDAFASEPNGGLLVVPEFTASTYRALIFRKALEHRLPGVYPFRFYAADGGLASYGPDQVEQYRGIAHYADRILRGAKPADLPVQAPTKFELIINLKTAKALGLEVPPTLLARADEVIE
jgi:putative ABC transport system substrate-binding protein